MKKIVLFTIFFISLVCFSSSPVFSASSICTNVGKCGAGGGCESYQYCQQDLTNEWGNCVLDFQTCPAPKISCNTNSDKTCQGKNFGDICGTSNLCLFPSGFKFTGQVPDINCACTYVEGLSEAISPTKGAPGKTPTITPTPTPEPLVSNGTECANGGTIYPPNSKCYTPVKAVEPIATYPISCVGEPTVSYSATSQYDSPPSNIDVTVTSDVSKATLGFLGPDSNTLDTLSSDQLAQKYLYNAIFGLPKNPSESTVRESFRTFWRMLNSVSQVQLKSYYLANVTNHTYYYLDSNNQHREVVLATLKAKLPFCLKNYGASAATASCWKNNKYLFQYDLLDKQTKADYDALMPFNFENFRAYLSNGTEISKENIPYLKAIISGLRGSFSSNGQMASGLLSYYTPNWAISMPVISTTLDSSIESTQYPAITASSVSSCQISSLSSSNSSPQTYPQGGTMTQTVTVPLTSTLVNTTPNKCYCDAPECRRVTCSLHRYSQTDCENYYCTFEKGATIYQLSGSTTGKPITVFNNPAIKTLNGLISGGDDSYISPLYKMLLPSYAKEPTKANISAPSITNSTSTENTTVTGSTTINREDNLAQSSMSLLQNCWLVPGDQQTSTKCGSSPKPVGACALSKEPLTGSCTKAGFTNFAQGSPYISVVPEVSAELSAVYAEAEKQTGVSCVILAAIHYMEANNDPCKSLISGREIGVPEPDHDNATYDTLLDTAISTGQEFAGKLDAVHSLFPDYSDYQSLITAFSFYNGGGNANCREPALAAYGHCPAQFRGEDDPYAVNWLDPNHAKMYLRCLTDGDCSSIVLFERPGAYTVALSYYLSLP